MTPPDSTACIDLDGQKMALTLYMFTACPFCQRVLACAKELGLSLEQRDIRQDADALSELMRIGHKKQVPCLVSNGRALYESANIMTFLRTQVRPAHTTTSR